MVKRKWFPLALPTDSYYGSESFSHDEYDCYDALLRWKDEHKCTIDKVYIVECDNGLGGEDHDKCVIAAFSDENLAQEYVKKAMDYLKKAVDAYNEFCQANKLNHNKNLYDEDHYCNESTSYSYYALVVDVKLAEHR